MWGDHVKHVSVTQVRSGRLVVGHCLVILHLAILHVNFESI